MKKVNAHAMELGLEVIVETKGGFTIEGKIIDYAMSRQYIWVENNVDIYQINTEVDNVFEASAMHVPADVVESYQAVLDTNSEEYIRANSHLLPAQDVLTMGELNKAIEQEAKGEGFNTRYDLEGARIMIYNNGEGYIRDNKGDWIDNLECWDCELVLLFEDDERVYKTFGTYFNEKDALKSARTMRSKLKAGKYPDIEKDIEIYTC
ncbi:hypothetical protein TAFFO16_1 [Bacillus phage Taffo16]|uniref:Uncharacterized protein n=1 Tax=Bacillus phage Taffo16 TaxID=2030094 RepID=A0A249XUV1_9CAUD|nr:hypothetical protein TAFFO16_1 [Bacillus phage Taffo16]ULF48622.1 hypothetical protein [Bacillus phage BillyBob]ULF48911.1 hypothetical protein [Bacillus phage BillyBob]